MDEDAEFFDRLGTSTGPKMHGARVSGIECAQPSGQPPSTMQLSGHDGIQRWARSGDLFWRASESCESLMPAFYRFDALPNIGLVVKRTATVLCSNGHQLADARRAADLRKSGGNVT